MKLHADCTYPNCKCPPWGPARNGDRVCLPANGGKNPTIEQFGVTSPAPSPAGGGAPLMPADRKAFIDAVILRVCELPDRTSPDDQPEMMLVSGDELSNILEIVFEQLDERAPASAPPPAGERTGEAAVTRENATLILSQQEGRCFYCAKPFERRNPADVDTWDGYRGVIFDHLIPRRVGGSHGPENRVAACPRCDGRKSGRLPTLEEMHKKGDQFLRRIVPDKMPWDEKDGGWIWLAHDGVTDPEHQHYVVWLPDGTYLNGKRAGNIGPAASAATGSAQAADGEGDEAGRKEPIARRLDEGLRPDVPDAPQDGASPSSAETPAHDPTCQRRLGLACDCFLEHRMAAALAKLRDEKYELQAAVSRAETSGIDRNAFDLVCADRDRLAEQLRQARANLRRYGGHTGDCSSHHGPECYCGWQEINRALASLPTADTAKGSP